MFRNLSGMLETEKCKEIQQLSTFMQVFMILFYYKERGVKMHKQDKTVTPSQEETNQVVQNEISTNIIEEPQKVDEVVSVEVDFNKK